MEVVGYGGSGVMEVVGLWRWWGYGGGGVMEVVGLWR